MSDLTIYTIGHSNHTRERFSELLKQYGIELLVDVRSSPYSRYNVQFNKEDLAAFLAENGTEYSFQGNSLGGRPNDPSCYDGNELNYSKVREKEWFNDGIAYVCWQASNRVIALLCAEEDPYECHRQHLVTQALLDKGVKVIHIRGDGSSQEATEDQEQLRLF